MTALDLFTPNWVDVWRGHQQEGVGAVFTRPEVVRLILDLADYRPEHSRLATLRVLEPSCGDGAFLSEIITRLITSEQIHSELVDWRDPLLDGAICAADLDASSVESARQLALEMLLTAGCPPERAAELSRQWTRHTDFLLESWPGRYDLVVGNPPYVRLEALPKEVLNHYRRRYLTATDRADLYVAFFERGLELLSATGALAFITANRFTKNQYGAALRRLLAERYHVRHYLNLEHTQPFLTNVSAYPAIVVIDREQGRPTRAGSLNDCLPETLEAVRREAIGQAGADSHTVEFATWYPAGAPWRSTSVAEHDFLELLEASLPTLEASGRETRVGIGVATGADEVFVLEAKSDEIEESQQIPLVMAGDIGKSGIEWSGHYLVNPFAASDDGSLVDLAQNPGLAQYFALSEERLRRRHVAKVRERNWFRTIDRVWPSLTSTAKLVIPDIQSGGVVGLDPGNWYPHHNVYWITSSEWVLSALQALLRSSYVLRQIRAWSVQMRGGSVRYQAQTLRRLRIPAFGTLPPALVSALSEVATSESQSAIDAVAAEAFSLGQNGARVLGV